MKGILTDVTLCIGCERCVEACTAKNKLGTDLPAKFHKGDGLTGNRFTSIVEQRAIQNDPATKESVEVARTVRKQCMHCLEPTCAAACLVGAFTKTEDGAVRYADEKCIGCRYCMLACPFGIPRYQYDELLPYVAKCRMDERCRVDGGAPACVSACPTGATIFGNRDDLIAEAKRRIKASPGKYYNDHLWGEKEFGGTSVMYLSDVDVGKTLGFPTKAQFEARAVGKLAESSIAHMVEPWVYVTPVQFGVVFTSLWGIWFIRRRQTLMAEGGHVPDHPGGHDDGAKEDE